MNKIVLMLLAAATTVIQQAALANRKSNDSDHDKKLSIERNKEIGKMSITNRERPIIEKFKEAGLLKQSDGGREGDCSTNCWKPEK